MHNDERIIKICVEQGFDEETMRYYEILLDDEGLNERQKLFVLGLLGSADKEVRRLKQQQSFAKKLGSEDIAKTVSDILRGDK